MLGVGRESPQAAVMHFSQSETQRRLDLLRDVMERRDLQALALIWGTQPGIWANEEFHLLQAERMPASCSITLVFRDRDPVVVTAHWHAFSDERDGVPYRHRVFADGENPGDAIAEVLQEHGVTGGRVGWRWSSVPAMWHLALTSALPDIEWVDSAADFQDVFYTKSADEAAVAAQSAAIADAGYQHLLDIIEPGMTEMDVAAEFERFVVRSGANKNFTIVASGVMSETTRFPRLAAPSRRVLEPGDSIMFELTPAVAGYYTQLVRVIHLGEANPWAERLRSATVSVIQAATENLRPGVTIGEIGRTIIDAARRTGLQAIPAIGHTAGVNLIYDPLLPTSDRVLHEHDVLIIHPKLHTEDGAYAFFWGETYLLTSDGHRRLNAASDSLQCIARGNA